MNYDLANPSLYRDIIVLYCPKKVGSTSLVSSIRISASDKFNIFHTHNEQIYKSFSIHKDLTIEDIIKNNDVINLATGKPRKIYIIDIFRTPIERKISEYFEDLATIHFNKIEEYLVTYPIDKIIKRFNNIFPYISTIDYYKEKYNLSNSSIPEQFDFKNKYISTTLNNVTWIKLRLKDSEFWNQILSNILGTEITIIKDYETSNKIISSLYNKFKSEYKLPYNYFKIIENDQELKYYYNFEERYEYLSSWYKNHIDTTIIPYTQNQYDFYMEISQENQFFEIKKTGHYIDNGCICSYCNNKRTEYLKIIKSGKKTNDVIFHDSNIDEINCKIFIKCFYPDGNIINMIYNEK
jgi:hypothetical protein